MHYRLKKFGEPIPVPGEIEDLWEDKQERILMMQLQKMEAETRKAMTAVDRLFGQDNQDKISDLHTVNEDEEEDDQLLTSK